MSEKLKELLEKINEEGVQQAEQKARAIESKVNASAQKIIKDAKNQAERIVEEAKDETEKMRQTAQMALRHASRDLVLSLKDEIRNIFGRVVSSQTVKAMSSEELGLILKSLIERYVEKNGKTSDVKVLLKKEDLENLKDTFFAKLKDTIKEGIEFKVSPNIDAGFSISFDKGKSFFDFTDEGIKEALCAYLNPELAKLLK